MMETISRANKILMILIEFHECLVCEQMKKLCNWLRWGGASLAPCVLAKIDQGGSSCPTFTLFRSVRNLFGNRSLGQPFKWWQTLWKSTRVNLACSANKAEFVLLVSRRGCESDIYQKCQGSTFEIVIFDIDRMILSIIFLLMFSKRSVTFQNEGIFQYLFFLHPLSGSFSISFTLSS